MTWRRVAVPLLGLWASQSLACQSPAALPPAQALPPAGTVEPAAQPPPAEAPPPAVAAPPVPAAPAPVAAPAQPAATGLLHQLVQVGPVSLLLHCVGSGSPAVILEAGNELPGSDWRAVQAKLGQLTRSCAYDRAGTGYSSAAPAGRSPDAVVEDLHGLLETAGISAPYVLVGHSLGGLLVRRYARRYREQVAGLVLVEATPAEATPVTAPKTVADHDKNFAARLAELRAARGSLGELPLVVLSRGKPQELPGLAPEQSARLEQEWSQLQGELTWLSKNSVQSVADKSGHFLHWDAPELVLAATQIVVQAARSSSPLDLAAALRAARAAAK
jgi:pimeloyl-ACP methyl ester carboxylesterase